VICIVGTHWGHFLGTQLRKFYTGPLLICGRDPARTQRIAGLLRADVLPDWESAVTHPDISALILALPPQMHCEVTLAALRAGKHVLVEKPLALNLEDCDAMIETAIRSDAVLAVGENVRFRPAILEAKRLLPQIGEPRLLVATALHGSHYQTATGILLDFAVHYIHAVRSLFGEPSSVYATGGEDHVLLVLAGDDGWKANLSLSWQASVGRCPEFVITGDKGAIMIWPENTSVDFYPVAPGPLSRAVAQIRLWWLKARLESLELQRRRFRVQTWDRMGYQAELRDFVVFTELNGNSKTRGENVASAIQGRRDIEVVMAAYESLEHHRPVRIRNTCSWLNPLPS
jgi:UDP-N-acetyl-2-amino-2-deoxyglucuronate dehydrogenase